MNLILKKCRTNSLEILKKLRLEVERGKKLFCTSSFQTHSIVLLHIISQFEIKIPVYFLDTGYHFPETIFFKKKIGKMLNLDVRDIFPELPKNLQRDSRGCLLYCSEPDQCCYFNKIQPFERLLNQYDIWISGIRKNQTDYRKSFQIEEKTAFRASRYHPILEWTDEMVNVYRNAFSLPSHPLDPECKISISCEPCTAIKYSGNITGRHIRWFGLQKTECGLHLKLRAKQ